MTSQKYTLSAQKREITGRKVKHLRSEGLIPAHVYGMGEQVNIQVSEKLFTKIYSEAGETGLIELQVEGNAKPLPVLIVGIERSPVLGGYLHIDFRKVDLTETIEANIPLEIIGEAPAVTEKGGVLVQAFNEISVEALPQDLPDAFRLDVSGLIEIGDSLSVEDLKVDTSKVTIQIEQDQVLVVINEPQAEVEEPDEPEELVTEVIGKSGEDKGEDKEESDKSDSSDAGSSES